MDDAQKLLLTSNSHYYITVTDAQCKKMLMTQYVASIRHLCAFYFVEDYLAKFYTLKYVFQHVFTCTIPTLLQIVLYYFILLFAVIYEYVHQLVSKIYAC